MSLEDALNIMLMVTGIIEMSVTILQGFYLELIRNRCYNSDILRNLEHKDMNYNIISENTLDYIFLHDCVIDNVSILDNNLILKFEHIDVLPEHPLNNFEQAKYTSSASLIFEDFEVTECVLYDTTNVKKSHIIAEKYALRVSLDIKDLGKEFEVLEFSKKVEEENYFTYEFSGIASSRYRSDFAMFSLKFRNVKVCWNELIDNSWFV